MDILLINPPFPVLPYEPNHVSPPLGLLYIAAELINQKHTVHILDSVVEGYTRITHYDDSVSTYGLSFDEIIDRINDIKPDVIGLSCLFSTLDSIIRWLAKRIKGEFPSIPIVLGGHHPTVFYSEFIAEEYIDFVIRGEGDIAFSELIEAIQGKRSLRQVANLTYKSDCEAISTKQIFLNEVDTIPYPARHLVNLEKYIKIGRMHGESKIGARATTIITSRGCPANCVFCSIHPVWGHRFRGHSSEHVLNEINFLHREYNINHIIFEDDNITFDKERAKEIFQGIIDEQLNITWSVPNGVAAWSLDEELLALMKQAGCHRLSLAVESGCQETLNTLIHKPLRLEQVEKIVTYCKKFHISTTAFFVVGLPGETKEMIQKSMTYAINLDVDTISIMIATPYPGTRLYDICLEKGYLDSEYQFHELTPHYSLINTDDFSSEDLKRIVKKTVIRRALRHPFGVRKRLLEKFRVAPAATLSVIFNYICSGFPFNRAQKNQNRCKR